MQQALAGQSTDLTAKDIFDLAKSGDTTALAVTDEVVDHIGFAIANVISIINPEAVILGGGISKSSPWFLPRVEKIVSEFAAVKTVIKTTTCGPNLGVIGAVSLVLREHESALKTF
jgi:glucokinase